MLIGLKQPTQGDIIYEPGTKIGVVFQTSVLDEMPVSYTHLNLLAIVSTRDCDYQFVHCFRVLERLVQCPPLY